MVAFYGLPGARGLTYLLGLQSHETYAPAHCQQLEVGERVARYVKTTKNMKLNMSLEEEKYVFTVTSWSDLGFAVDKSDRKSYTGGVLTVTGVIVHWICKKQTVYPHLPWRPNSPRRHMFDESCWDCEIC